jgi:hypothetical protein
MKNQKLDTISLLEKIFFSQKKVIVQFQRQNRLMDLKEVQLIILSQCFGSIENEIYFSEIKSFTEALARYYN